MQGFHIVCVLGGDMSRLRPERT